jgi:hypothetical protein
MPGEEWIPLRRFATPCVQWHKIPRFDIDDPGRRYVDAQRRDSIDVEKEEAQTNSDP